MVFKNEIDMPEQCPPAHAVAENVEPVFRYIENQDVDDIDFQNHIERNLFYHPEDKCEAIALSFYTTEEAAKGLAKRVKKFRKKKLAKGKITTNCGIHIIENHHLNLWVFKEVDMLKVFLGEEM